MRHAHFLKGNKGTELPHSCIWVDTETDPVRLTPLTIEHRLRFGWAAAQRTIRGGQWSEPEWCRFGSPGAFWTWAEGRVRPRTRCYLFAHNWSFDAPVLGMFEELPKRGWQMTRAIVEGPPVCITWRRESSTLQVLDTLNWWRVPLNALGASLGIPKLAMPDQDAGRAEWDLYCRTDVEILRLALLRWFDFLKTHDLGGFASTLAAQAMRTYRHRFMAHQILIDDNARALRLARASYHGGRTECFRLGRVEGPIHVFDINSQYPFVMREREYPVALQATASDASLSELARWCEDYAVVAKCEMETYEPAYAHVYDDRLIFPTGRFSECLTTPDILYALEHDHIRSVGDVALYSKAPLFARFVDDLYAHRLDAADRGDPVSALLFKLLLNSLYGKFGQRGGKWTECARTDDREIKVWAEVDVDTGTVHHYRQFAGIVQTKDAMSESSESHPAIASHVTAYARRYLWELIERVGRTHLYYCDTDSLWVDQAGCEVLDDLIDPRILGRLKHEATHDWAIFRGPKDYQTPGLIRCKGVRASAHWTSQDSVLQEKWSSLKGLIRSGQLSAPRTETIKKTMARIYRKGRSTLGGRILPLHLTE